VCLEILIKDLPIMDEALMVYEKGMTTGVNAYNRRMVDQYLRLETDWPPLQEEIVFDPQTSGGLLVAVPESQGESLVNALHAKGVKDAGIIGNVHELKEGVHLRFK